MHAEERNAKPSFVDTIKLIPAFLSLIAASALGASVIYDWGYFGAINLAFPEVPITLADHVETALLWLPLLIVVLICTLILNLVVVRLERGIDAEERIRRSRFPKIARFWEQGWMSLLRIGSVVAILVFLFFPYGRLDHLKYPLFIAWVVFGEWIVSHEAVRRKLPLGFMLFLLALGIVLIELGLTGRGDALDALHDNQNIATITLVPSGEQLKDVHIIRTFSSNILLYDDKNNLVRLVENAQIGLIDWKYREDTFNGLIKAQTTEPK